MSDRPSSVFQVMRSQARTATLHFLGYLLSKRSTNRAMPLAPYLFIFEAGSPGVLEADLELTLTHLPLSPEW